MFDIPLTSLETIDCYLESSLSRINQFVHVPIPIIVPLQIISNNSFSLDYLEYRSQHHPNSIFPTESTEGPMLIYDVRSSLRQSSDNFYPRSIFENQHEPRIEHFNSLYSTLVNITDFSVLENIGIEPFNSYSQQYRIITLEIEQTFWEHDGDIVIQDRAIREAELCRREFIEGIIYGTIGRLNDLDIVTAIGTSTTETPSISPLQLSYRRNDPALALVIEFRLLLNEIIDNNWNFDGINFSEMQQQAVAAAIDKNIKKLLKIINKTRTFIAQQKKIETPSLEIINNAIVSGDFEGTYDLITTGISNELMSEVLRLSFEILQEQEISYSVIACNLDDIIKFLLTRGAELNLAIVCNMIIGGSRNVASYLDILFQHRPEFTIDTVVPGSALTLLIMAIIDRNIDAVKILIEKGADINQPGTDGLTPLMHAIRTQQLNIAYMLLEEDTINVNAISVNGESPLTIAVIDNYIDIIKLLISHGADIHHRDKNGFTPLMHAANIGNLKAVWIIVENSKFTIEELEEAKAIALKHRDGKIETIIDNKILATQMESVSIGKAIFGSWNIFTEKKEE